MDLQLAARTELRITNRAVPSNEPFTWKVGPLLGRRISAREKADFCTQLAVMLQAKVPLHKALRVLSDQSRSPRMRAILEVLVKDVQKGTSFSRALERHPQAFDRLFVVTAEVGQESGRLAEVLLSLSEHLEKIASLKRKVAQALAYPALVVSVACFAVVFLLLFIVPSFAEMFKSFQIELPLATRIVLRTSSLLTAYGPYALLMVPLLLYVAGRTLRNEKIGESLQSAVIRLPLVGTVLLENHVARFCRTLGTLLYSQVSLVEALAVTQRITVIPALRSEVGQIGKHVKQGRAVAEPLVHSRLFPPMVAQMIAVGEETSELDRMLIKVAEYYEKDLDSKMETLSTLIEPIIVLLLGLFVASILIAMYLPMFELVNVVGGG